MAICFCLITVKSLLELIPYIFSIPGVKVFLSERLRQDPLNYSLDARGNVVALMRILLFKSSIYKNTQALRVINSFHLCGDCERELSWVTRGTGCSG